jgi:hypothetical protein
MTLRQAQGDRDAWSRLTASLTARAAALAQAYGESLLRARQDDPTRWRRAVLLWPLFTKDP